MYFWTEDLPRKPAILPVRLKVVFKLHNGNWLAKQEIQSWVSHREQKDTSLCLCANLEVLWCWHKVVHTRSVVLANTFLSSWGRGLCTVKKVETCFILQNIPEIWKSCKNDGELYFCSYKGNLPEWRKWFFPKQRFWCQKSLSRRLNQRWGKIILKLSLQFHPLVYVYFFWK